MLVIYSGFGYSLFGGNGVPSWGRYWVVGSRIGRYLYLW